MLHLDPEESVILEVHRHWFVFLGYIVAFKVAIFSPIIVYICLYLFAPTIYLIVQPYLYFFTFAYFIWLLFCIMIFFIRWTDFHLDVWYITQKRIIDMEQKSMFHREVANLRFDKIQDISIKVNGLIATMLNFGDIHVQTAGEDSSDFFLLSAKNPERVRKVIFSQHNIEAERQRRVTVEKNMRDESNGNYEGQLH